MRTETIAATLQSLLLTLSHCYERHPQRAVYAHLLANALDNLPSYAHQQPSVSTQPGVDPLLRRRSDRLKTDFLTKYSLTALETGTDTEALPYRAEIENLLSFADFIKTEIAKKSGVFEVVFRVVNNHKYLFRMKLFTPDTLTQLHAMSPDELTRMTRILQQCNHRRLRTLEARACKLVYETLLHFPDNNELHLDIFTWFKDHGNLSIANNIDQIIRLSPAQFQEMKQVWLTHFLYPDMDETLRATLLQTVVDTLFQYNPQAPLPTPATLPSAPVDLKTLDIQAELKWDDSQYQTFKKWQSNCLRSPFIYQGFRAYFHDRWQVGRDELTALTPLLTGYRPKALSNAMQALHWLGALGLSTPERRAEVIANAEAIWLLGLLSFRILDPQEAGDQEEQVQRAKHKAAFLYDRVMPVVRQQQAYIQQHPAQFIEQPVTVAVLPDTTQKMALTTQAVHTAHSMAEDGTLLTNGYLLSPPHESSADDEDNVVSEFTFTDPHSSHIVATLSQPGQLLQYAIHALSKDRLLCYFQIRRTHMPQHFCNHDDTDNCESTKLKIWDMTEKRYLYEHTHRGKVDIQYCSLADDRVAIHANDTLTIFDHKEEQVALIRPHVTDAVLVGELAEGCLFRDEEAFQWVPYDAACEPVTVATPNDRAFIVDDKTLVIVRQIAKLPVLDYDTLALQHPTPSWELDYYHFSASTAFHLVKSLRLQEASKALSTAQLKDGILFYTDQTALKILDLKAPAPVACTIWTHPGERQNPDFKVTLLADGKLAIKTDTHREKGDLEWRDFYYRVYCEVLDLRVFLERQPVVELSGQQAVLWRKPAVNGHKGLQEDNGKCLVM